MKPATVRHALLIPGLKPQTSRLLTYMADRASSGGQFWESRERSLSRLGIDATTMKRALRELVQLGYVSELAPARKGQHARIMQLHPDAWPPPI